MANGYILSQAVRTAAELGVADHLGGDPLTADELAAQTGVKDILRPDVLKRLDHSNYIIALRSCY